MNRRGKEMYIDSVNCDEYKKQMNQLKADEPDVTFASTW